MIPSLSGEVFSFEEFDIDFEFDAPRFYDFSRPELDSETEEIEFWFESAGNYPPSPFSPKCNWKLEPLKQITNIISETKPVEISKPVIESGLNRKDQYNGFIYYNQTVKDVSKTKPKSKTKSCCSSTLTRPTASLLARQNKPLDVYSVQLLTRCQRSLAKFGGNLSPILDSKLQNKDTKRPKLEAKVSRVNSNRRSKLTVPKEPNLRTAERSERHRSKLNSETEQNAKPRISSSKRNTTNKNINVEPCSTPLPKSNTPRSQDLLQEFGLRTLLRAKERSSNEPNLRTAERSERHRSKLNSETEQNAKPRISSSKRNTTNKNINVEPCSTPLPKSNTPRSQDLLQEFGLRTLLRAKERSSNAKIDAIQENIATNSRMLKPTKSPKGRLVKGNHSSQVSGFNICPLGSAKSSREKLGEPTSIKYGTPSSYRTDINRSMDLCRKFDSQEVSGSLIIA
ncbi:hypothetical protein DY000_02006097 [Brassica cretica]|uniref:TPX2 central domain-containing protein n=1 Tax=Brassica cretica TaxID=69181 RepID=A0ABQ7BZW5_BRACR|nr:hypothetical protein DY000_02006097 [Brassica cretica]